MLQTYSNLIAKKTLFANLPTFTFLVILFAMFALPTSAQEPVVIVEPLIKTKWGQGGVFNDMFPKNNDGNNVLAGCGNVAWAQMIAYHKYPARGVGESGPTKVRGLAVPSVNFEIDYDWDNILDTYTSSATEQQRNAVATLMYHVGAARDGSGKSNQGQMVNVFGYDKSIQYLQRRFYTDNEWEAIIKQQLDLGLPVYYHGTDPGSDHAFIVDGYDNAGNFHINWGWGGSSDGWNSLNNLRGNKKWSNNNSMTINMMPNQGGVAVPYEMALVNFSVNKTSVSQNELFTAKAQARNLSTFDTFNGGRYGLALVDAGNNIVAIIADINAVARAPMTNSSHFEVNSFVPETVPPGKYKLRVAVKPTDGDWKVITKSAIRDGIHSAFDFTVTPYQGTTPGGGYGLALTNFSTERTYANHGESTSFTVNYRFRNITSEQFPSGQAGAALVDDSGNIVAVIGTRDAGSLAAGSTGSARTLTSTVPATVEPGVYHLRIVNRLNANDPWRIATLSLPNIPNSIEFGIIKPGNTGMIAFASDDGNGTVRASVDGDDIASGDLVVLGKKVILRAIPDDNHHIVGWTVNGVAVLGNATETLEITAIRAATIVKAMFIENDFYYNVSSYANATEDVVIDVNSNFTLDSLVNIPMPATTDITLTIRSANAATPATLLRGAEGNLFTVPNGAKLILENIIIQGALKDKVIDDGNDDENIIIGGDEDGDDDSDDGSKAIISSLVRINAGGAFVINDGAVLRNNESFTGGGLYVNGGAFTMNGGEISNNAVNSLGGGLYINDGTFTMNGGKIIGNITGKNGGGVNINSGTFTMTGGEISGNTARSGGGGVNINSGTFTMTGGEIIGNTAGDGGAVHMTSGNFIMESGVIGNNTSADGGGGLDVSGSSTVFTMKGGKIVGNTATNNGGGMALWSNAKFNMEGGEFSGNTSGTDGAGMSVSGASTVFTMTGGKITGNTANTNGGGVRISSGTFTMTGGEISGNTAVADGGGIRLSGGKFTMNDGKIIGNTALDGGGMDISGSSTTVTMNGGEISGNVATKIEGNTDAGRGGGMTVWSSAKFTMNGGKITGNVAGVNAGGTYVSGTNTVFTMKGGEIIGNTAPVGNGINRASGTVNLNGGVVIGTGANMAAVVSGTHNLNKGEGTPNNAVIFAWNKPAGEDPYIYEQGTSTNLTVSAGATAVWENKDDKIGILYKNTDNEGFMEIVGITLITRDNIDIALAKEIIENSDFGSVSQETLNTQEEAKLHVEKIIAELELNGVDATVADGIFTEASDGTNGSYTFTVKLNKGAGIEQVTETLTLTIIAAPYGTPAILPQLAKTTIQASSANKTIILQNLPANAKVEVYNLQGKRIYSANHENPKILKVGVQTGVYIVKAGYQTLRVAVR